jgi:serine protease
MGLFTTGVNEMSRSRNTMGIKFWVLFAALSTAASGVFGQTNTGGPTEVLRAEINYSALHYQAEFDQFIVKFRDQSEAYQKADVRSTSVARVAVATGQNLSLQNRLAIGSDVVKVEGAKLTPKKAQVLMEAFADLPEVEAIEPDARMTLLLTPNDTRYTQQWHYFESTAGMNLPLAWDLGTGSGVVVAVIDTGITPHSDLMSNVIAGYDFITDATVSRDGNGRDNNPNDEGDWTTGECLRASSSSWHGTHVAGTVAAQSNNALGVAGVAFGAKVQPVRVLGRCGGTLSDIADAIVWASGGTVSGIPVNPTPAKVINMSLGGSGSCGTTYQSAINAAVARGTTVVVAAGNENANANTARPANCTNVVAVAAVNRQGARAYYSNYGTVVDVAAPGGDLRTVSADGVLSTLNTGTTTQGSETYAYYQGTSMAAPHVAGLVALMIAAAPTLTPASIESALKSNTRPLPGACSGGCGTGIVDSFRTLQAVTGTGGGGGGTSGIALTNGSPVTGLAGSASAELYYTINVPAGASNLQIAASGGTGDADLYVKFGARPTTTSYDCRPYLSGNAETCSFATPQVGTYHVVLRGYSAFSGVTLRASYSTGGGGTTLFQNTLDYTIADNTTVESPISVTGLTGNAPTSLQVAVRIIHTYRGDLKVDLVAPNGSVFTLSNYSGGSADNIVATYTVNASASPANGSWRLRVNDNAAGDVGYIDSWSLQF